MKKLLSFVLFGLLFSFQAYAQEKPLFDYEETKHELSLDIDPIINGNYPSTLLYRRHYKTKNDKNAALRFGLNFSSDFRTIGTDFTPINSTDFQNHFYAITIGKEWQQNLTTRIIGYYGIDLGFAYSGSRSKPNADDPAFITTQKGDSFNYSSIGFLGMKYHFSRHFSVSAETGVSARFSHSIYTEKRGISEEEKNKTQNFGLSFIPLRAIRFAFHF
ncbi:hypothetical protein [Arthrospiribacter ruber]|uniref:Outer membrane protein beta-barrel domain-containing protein n=1 Tax=Arthrospiribacter ruber TaxID=2487934 RepID=A0A951IZ10_9BACT|nr:hypothetical protein [Arthrospiribacter ruber]MBW3469453.1 hypothetical protein [Arthrospiribacter ruber]